MSKKDLPFGLKLLLTVMTGKACNVVCVVKSLQMQVKNHAGKLKKYFSSIHPKISLDIVDFFFSVLFYFQETRFCRCLHSHKRRNIASNHYINLLTALGKTAKIHWQYIWLNRVTWKWSS